MGGVYRENRMFIEQHWIFDEYRTVFRHYTPAIFVQEQMLDQITDRAAWKQTCFDWGMNDYKPSSVGKMLDYYRQRIAQRTNAYVGQSHETPERDYKCSSCFDKGQALVENPAVEFGWETIPCPDCREAIAA